MSNIYLSVEYVKSNRDDKKRRSFKVAVMIQYSKTKDTLVHMGFTTFRHGVH